MSGYPSAPGYPPGGPGYPPMGGQEYPPGLGGYPPPGHGGYPPPGSGYPPPNSGYPPGPGFAMGQGQGYGPPQGYPYPPMQPGDEGFEPPSGYAYPPIPRPIEPGPIMHQPQPGQGPPGYPYAPPHYSQPVVGYFPSGGPQGPPPIQFQPQGYGGGHSVPINVPPGLEYLTSVDQLFVKQKVEMLEAILGCETKNKYKIKNNHGQVIYTAKEDTDCCTRNCCGPLRPFDLLIRDSQEREVIHLSRPFACDSCLCPCLMQSIEVQAPPGTPVGRVVQDWSLCTPQFRVLDASGETVLRIEGPLCTFSLCGSVEFQILSKDGSTQVGKISKQWSGLLREAFTDADNFGLSFPIDLDVRMKAVMLGALFLIDFMFFEKQNNQESDGLGML